MTVSTIPVSDELLLHAIELRVLGNSWENIGKALDRSAETVRRWPAKYAPRWKNLYFRVEKRLAVESAAEALCRLRIKLRRESDEEVGPTAQAVLNYRLGLDLTEHRQQMTAIRKMKMNNKRNNTSNTIIVSEDLLTEVTAPTSETD
jgi:hypothetical protein